MVNARHVALLMLIALVTIAPDPAAAKARGDGDHPLIGRYEGSELVGRYDTSFDEVELINGPITNARGIGAPGWLHVEGQTTLLYYTLPADRSSLEVLRNYQSSLEGKGFRIAYTCVTGNGSCYEIRQGHVADSGPYAFALAFDANPELPRLDSDFIRNYFRENARYLLARRSGAQGTTYVAIVIAENSVRGNHAFIRVVETKEMESNRISFVSAPQIRSALADKGRISLYGIQFDFDKDDIQPGSRPTLDEIGQLLKSDPSLRLTVTGHTDAQGGRDYNLDLSRRRAVSVVHALITDYGIDRTRLETRGAGDSEPLAANDTDANRALNRRVELVRK